MIAFPVLLRETQIYQLLPLGPRIPVLAMIHCFPVAMVLSMLTPLAIRIGVPNVGRTGRVAGLIFSLSTLGCLLGNYVTGFVLIPNLTINSIVLTSSTLFFLTAGGVLLVFRSPASHEPEAPAPAAPSIEYADEHTGSPVLPMPFAYAIVFLCSFAGMTLELSSTRLLAQVVGVSIYTWTGVIGVMLAGTALGNWIGGQIADRGGGHSWESRTLRLAGCMILAGVFCVVALVMYGIITHSNTTFLSAFGLIGNILGMTFVLFFAPMLLLGMVSPQVIRLAVADVSVAGRVAGRIYAFSTAGAIVGTFTTGYLLISTIGVYTTILVCSIFPILAVTLIQGAFKNSMLLYATSAALGGVVGGFLIRYQASDDIALETNYYTIRVSSNPILVLKKDSPEREPLGALAGATSTTTSDKQRMRKLLLDHLVHSEVDIEDPGYLYYKHEQFQLEMVHQIRESHSERQKVLVIGGGGYTYPRCVRTRIPTSQVDVVEIDPGVTAVAYSHLNLDRELNIGSFHMDGRQFVAEKAKPDSYHLITLDAVNDLSVPWHLLTKEFNDSVKKTLTSDGIYLVTVIDFVNDGKLWKAAAHTLRESFPHVEMVFPKGQFDVSRYESLGRSVIVLYASSQPLSPDALEAAVQKHTKESSQSLVVPREILDKMLGIGKKIILTDQYAPVDNLMAEVFRKRE
jgi:spermidine synthase